MANVDAKFGLAEVANGTGGTDYPLLWFDIAVTNAVKLGHNDPVRLVTGGVARSAATEEVDFVIAAIEDTNGKSITILPALTAGRIGVGPTKGRFYKVQSSAGNDITFPDDIAKLADLLITDANDNTGTSTTELDSGTIGTGSTVRILAPSLTADNEFSATGDELVKVIVEVVLTT